MRVGVQRDGTAAKCGDEGASVHEDWSGSGEVRAVRVSWQSLRTNHGVEVPRTPQALPFTSLNAARWGQVRTPDVSSPSPPPPPSRERRGNVRPEGKLSHVLTRPRRTPPGIFHSQLARHPSAHRGRHHLSKVNPCPLWLGRALRIGNWIFREIGSGRGFRRGGRGVTPWARRPSRGSGSHGRGET